MGRLKLISWNVNGLRALYARGFLDWFNKEQMDICCLQETKVSEDQLPPALRHIDGYTAYFDAPAKKGYCGLALYSKPVPKHMERGFDVPDFDAEGRIQIADYDAFILMNVYFPNGQMSDERLRYKLQFYDLFLKKVDALIADRRHVVVCGDVNTAHKEIDLARPKANETRSGFLPVERAWLDKFMEHGLVDTFRMFNQEPGQYTWWDVKSRARERNVGWRLDYFYVDDGFKGQVEQSYIMSDVMGSDHCPVALTIRV